MKMDLEEKLKYLFLKNKFYKFRSIILLIGSKAGNNIPYLHYLWSKNSTQLNSSFLWCYNNDFFTNNLKKNRKIDKKSLNLPKIRFCYYSEINKIVGNTFGVCVLENFEALSPNLLVKIIETIEGGGLIIFLLDCIERLDDIRHIALNIYEKFKTESCNRVIGRFLERFLFSLQSCQSFIGIDENLNIFSANNIINYVNSENSLKVLYKSLQSNKDLFFELIKSVENLEPISSLIGKTRTFDQARALLTLIESISDKLKLKAIILTAARGRGKSATLGLSTAAAIAYGYSRIYVTAPNPENLNTFFAFFFIGLKVLNYQENKHFKVLQDSRYKYIRKINIHCTHMQNVSFVYPWELEQHKNEIELLIIDEAASISIPILNSICNCFTIFMSTTTSGYEGTGKYFSLKFIKKLKTRLQKLCFMEKRKFLFQEITLDEPIRYSTHDPVEKWLNDFLCLELELPSVLLNGCPNPKLCKLFLVDRNALFSTHKIACCFLQKIFSLLISVHYRNSPDDLQMLCDAPSHRILALIAPLSLSIGTLPDVLGVLHISYEGQISKKFIENNLNKKIKVNGDLIPWIISKEFFDSSFAELPGVRILRIAIHPDIQNMGYGSRLVKIFTNFVQNIFKLNIFGKFDKKNIKFTSKTILESSTLLINLEKRNPPKLDYIGVSFGITKELFHFWKKNGFSILFIGERKNQITGEYISIMIYPVTRKRNLIPNWFKAYQFDFLYNFLLALDWKYKEVSSIIIFSIIQNTRVLPFLKKRENINVRQYLDNSLVYKMFFFSNNFSFEYNTLLELLPKVAKIIIYNSSTDKKFLLSEILLLISIGLQKKTIETVMKEFKYNKEEILFLSKDIFTKFIQIYLLS